MRFCSVISRSAERAVDLSFMLMKTGLVASETRKSTSGFAITLNGSPIAWKIVHQTIVALSSAEDEYVEI